MTLSYRKANALVHDTYFLSFKVFFIEVCARKKFIVCVHAWVQKGLYCNSIHSNRLHGFLCGFQVYHNNSIESLFCQTRFFGCCLTKQLAKTEETKIKITFFQDTISVRKNLKFLSTFQVQSRKELHLYGPGGDWLLHQEEQCQRWVQQRHHGHRVSGTTSGTVD